ncbi:MAG: hypothetical protein ABSG16_12340 [Candidatus Acidiferrum sp.]
METLSPEVIEDLRHARAARERKLAVCSSGAHLGPADRAEILAVLASDADEMVATRAQEALLSQPIENFLLAIQRPNAIPAVFAYAAHNLAGKPGVADAMVQNGNCPPACLIPVIPHLSVAKAHELADDLARLSESPALTAALEHSSSVSAEQKSLLRELHGPGVAMDEAALADAAELAEPDPQRRQTLLQVLAKMNVAERVKFAVRGGADARRTLIRDSNKVVQRAVLQSPKLTDQEVESFAAMATLTDEILRIIAGNRKFRKNYNVIRNLLNNPKTPLDVSLHLLPAVNAIDLKKLGANKNIPETLRTTAGKLQRTRAEFKK